jgi:replicative DNA helicase
MTARRLHAVDRNDAEPTDRCAALTAPLAERALIAAVVDADTRRTSGEQLPDIVAAVGGPSLLRAFSDAGNRRLWEIVCERHRQGLHNDLLSVAPVFRAEQVSFGGATFQSADLAEWIDHFVEATESAIPTLATTYADEIRATAERRQKLADARALVEALECYARPLEAWYEEAVAPLVAVKTSQSRHKLSVSERVVAVMTDIGKLLEAGRACVVGIPSGLSALDTHLGGLRAGDLIVVAGRTGLGKTALSLTVGLNAARAGFGVCFATMEMPAQTLLQRLLAQITGIEVSRLWRGPLGPRDHEQLVRGADELSRLPLSFVEGERSWPEVASECRRAVGKGARLVVIDYLGLLGIPDSRMDRWEMIGTITAEAKQLALTASVPVLLLAQLNREVTKDGNKRPSLWHLRDSGCIEQDADIVLLLHRDGAYDRTAHDDTAEINVAKFRNGPTGVVTVRWRREIARFEDLPAPYDEEDRA